MRHLCFSFHSPPPAYEEYDDSSPPPPRYTEDDCPPPPALLQAPAAEINDTYVERDVDLNPTSSQKTLNSNSSQKACHF